MDVVGWIVVLAMVGLGAWYAARQLGLIGGNDNPWSKFETENLERVEPHPEFRVVFEDLKECAQELDEEIRNPDREFDDFRWWTADIACLRGDCRNAWSVESGDTVDILIVRYDRNVYDISRILKAAVHEMGHSFAGTGPSHGHGHSVFDDCTAVDLRPELYPEFD